MHYGSSDDTLAAAGTTKRVVALLLDFLQQTGAMSSRDANIAA